MKPLAASDPGKVGPYRTAAVLGSGAMGRVLLGRATDGELVALKRIHPGFSDDEGFRVRFRREVKASGKVRGSYTAKVIADDTDARVPWMATEFIAGLTLQESVDSCGPFPADAVLRLAAGLAAALTDIHRVELVHRDLKPSNIMLTHDGLKVIDFGIARAVDASTLTGTGTIMGSYAFMSPEQVLADEAGHASDVFALGAVLGFAATGHGPFDATTVPAITHRILNAEPRLDEVDGTLRGFIEGCLVKVPDDRPSTATLLAAIPEEIRRSIGAGAAAPWDPAIHELIDRQRQQIDRFVEASGVSDTVIDPASTVIPRDVGRAGTKVDDGSPVGRTKVEPRSEPATPEPESEPATPEPATVPATGPDSSITGWGVRRAATDATTTSESASKPPTPRNDRTKKDLAWHLLGWSVACLLILLFIPGFDGLIDGASGSHETTAAADGDTGGDFDEIDDDGHDADDDQPNASAGCDEAFGTMQRYLNIANPALERDDTAEAVDALRDMASQLRTDASEATSTLVVSIIDSLADDADELADALVAGDDDTYDHWRDLWADDRDELSDTCYE